MPTIPCWVCDEGVYIVDELSQYGSRQDARQTPECDDEATMVGHADSSRDMAIPDAARPAVSDDAMWEAWLRFEKRYRARYLNTISTAADAQPHPSAD